MKTMKKIVFGLLILLFLPLCGCSLFPQDRIETLTGWSFQLNEGTNDYSLFFGLLNQDGKAIFADVDVDIRIVNEDGEEVYTATASVSEEDFGYYTSQTAGEEYLANVRIPASDIAPGTSESGTVFLTVYKTDVASFDEVHCDALYCLPIKDIQLICDSLPLQLAVPNYLGDMDSVIEINGVAYSFDKDSPSMLKITLSGKKIQGDDASGYDIIGYKLYDSDDYLVDSGSVYLSALSEGDKFKDSSIIVYDVIPGTTYVLKLTESDW